MKNNKILGFWSNHDCSYCILEDGVPIIHDEYERFIREKEPPGDSLKFYEENFGSINDIKYFATCYPLSKASQYFSFENLTDAVSKNDGKLFKVGHHEAHAANAFFSSNIKKSLIVTIDGGGIEDSVGTPSAFTVWEGNENKIKKIDILPHTQINIGSVWTRCTRYIFNLQSGWPTGHQAGTVMAMAALGDGSKYLQDFSKMLKEDLNAASFKPLNQPSGANTGNDPEHPYLNKFKIIAEKSDQDKWDLAASLQLATEIFVRDILSHYIKEYKAEYLCLSGGVILNSVMAGKLYDWFPMLKSIYITPTPHDGGLAIGAAQYAWHQILDNPRIDWKDNCTPYLGKTYSRQEVENTIEKFQDTLKTQTATTDDIINFVNDQKIVAIFGGGSESGRRALGNRSILADPRSPQMKDRVNEKVKHRQWFRPFAPSILRDEVSNWFERDIDSPYMGFCIKFKQEKKDKVPAVVHFDSTARLQTVTKNDNPWYYNFLKKWNDKSGVPIILNTSFNDTEPICEIPEHAIKCFLKTEIDYLYFYDHDILVSKS